MKKIETLVDDILALFDENNSVEVSDELIDEFAQNMGKMMKSRLSRDTGEPPRLRPSNIGTPCKRKLWYTMNTPEVRQPFEPTTLIKFLFGDVVEELMLFLSKAAGHTVEGEQDKMEIYGIAGSRDCVIDGEVVDVKSASSYSFRKFKDGLPPEDDGFGYRDQLNFYLKASEDDPLVKRHDRAHFLAFDKQNANITLCTIPRDPSSLGKKIAALEHMVEQENAPRRLPDKEEGKSGNMKLPVSCEYCDFNKTCKPHRTFLYKTGFGYRPVHLTKVVREPNVPEV